VLRPRTLLTRMGSAQSAAMSMWSPVTITPHTQSGTAATGTNTATTAALSLTAAQATATATAAGHTTTAASTAARPPVPDAAARRHPTAATVRLRGTTPTPPRSIRYRSIAPPVAAILAPRPMRATALLTATGRTTARPSTGVPRPVRTAAIPSTSTQTMPTPTATGFATAAQRN